MNPTMLARALSSGIIFLFLFFTGAIADAQIAFDSEAESYNFVRRTCSTPDEAFAELYSDATLANFDATGRVFLLDFSGVTGLATRRGFNSKIKMILESDSLHRALRDCFGDQSDLKKFYVAHLIAANTAAFYAGVVGGIGGPAKALAWGFQLLRRLGWDASVQYLVRRGLLSESGAIRLGYVAAGTIVVSLAAPAFLDANDARIAKNHAMRADFESKLKDFKDFADELAKLSNSSADRAYAIELGNEMSAIGKKLLGNPAASKPEIAWLAEQLKSTPH